MTSRTQNLINIALVLLVFPTCALLARDILAYRYALRGVEAARPEVRPPARLPEIRDFAGIVEKPVFPTPAEKLTPLAGAEAAGAPRPVADPGKLLNGLRLIGTYVGAKSFAVFKKTDDLAEGAFGPGDEVFGRGLLKSVAKKSAVIVLEGAEVELKMPEEELPEPRPLTPLPRGAPPGRAFVPPPSPPSPAGLEEVSRQTGENEWVVSQAAVLNALEDMGAVLSAARMTPVREGQDVTGFLVTEIRPRGIMDAIGLKNGDILRRVNGFEITSPERAVQVLSALKGETSFDLDIVRGGENLSFHYDIR